MVRLFGGYSVFTSHLILLYLYSLQKLQERRSSFAKRHFRHEEDKAKWQKVLISEMMSSEDSVRPLPWRSEKVNHLFEASNERLMSKKSAQAKRQTEQRIIGEPSDRPKSSSTIIIGVTVVNPLTVGLFSTQILISNKIHFCSYCIQIP